MRDTDPVKPVPGARGYAIKDHVSRQVYAMVELHLAAGMRRGEVTRMRPVDINTTDEPWVYSPQRRKTAHHDVERAVYLGRNARETLAPFLAGRAFETFRFSPAEAEAERREKLRAARNTPLSCGNRAGTNRRRRPKRSPGPRYTVNAYLPAIYTACNKAFPPPEHLAKGKDETTAQWRQRLTPELRKELFAWRAAHRWHPAGRSRLTTTAKYRVSPVGAEAGAATPPIGSAPWPWPEGFACALRYRRGLADAAAENVPTISVRLPLG